MNSKFSEFFGGVRSVAPLLIGTFPFGLIYGAAAIAYHLKPVTAQSMSIIVFAGSAQFIMVQMIGSGVPAIIIIITAAIVNVRHILYSAALTAQCREIRPKFWRWLLAYLLVDEVFAAIITRFQSNQNPQGRQWYFLGAGCALWGIWQISTAIGIFVGAKIPAAWNLDFTLQLTFIAIVTPAIKKSSHAIAAAAAVAAAIVTIHTPLKLGLLLSVGAAIGAGFLWISMFSKQESSAI